MASPTPCIIYNFRWVCLICSWLSLESTNLSVTLVCFRRRASRLHLVRWFGCKMSDVRFFFRRTLHLTLLWPADWIFFSPCPKIQNHKLMGKMTILYLVIYNVIGLRHVPSWTSWSALIGYCEDACSSITLAGCRRLCNSCRENIRNPTTRFLLTTLSINKVLKWRNKVQVRSSNELSFLCNFCCRMRV